MPVNIHIERNGNENPMSTLRRFRNRLRSSGVLNRARELRYHDRAHSKYTAKKSRLRALERAKEKERLYKLGKISERQS